MAALHAYIRILILADVYRYASFFRWFVDYLILFFAEQRTLLCRKTDFKGFSISLRFHDVDSQSQNHRTDNFTPIRVMWDRWIEILLQIPRKCVSQIVQLSCKGNN